MPVGSGDRPTQAANSLAEHTKQLCSGVFVVGRNPYEFVQHDLRTIDHYHDWDATSVDVDVEDRTVTLADDRGNERTAVYHPSQGCTLLPEDGSGISFEPSVVSPNLEDPHEQEWPMGDVGAVAHDPDSVDTDRLSTVLDRATGDPPSHAMPPGTRALVVLKGGKIVGERYASGFNRRTRHVSWSMGKSVTAALIGILVEEGHFDVDDPAPIEAWRGDDRHEIRISDLLRMSSGLEFRRSRDEAEVPHFMPEDHHHRPYFDSIDVFDFATGRPLEHEPNTVWRYRNCDPLTLGRIIRETVESTGRSYLEFPQRALYDRIGVRDMVHEPDRKGNFIMSGFNYGTARDWARFGLLHLWEGEWLGERILPEDWVDFVTTPAPADPEGGYGGQFWLNRNHELPEVPEDAYSARGYRGQLTMVVPSRDAVIVRLGHTPTVHFEDFNTLIREILDCLEA
jgi:CubicO group peptidase (beta-lactamase class C family)